MEPQKIPRPYQSAYDLFPEHQEPYVQGSERLLSRLKESSEDLNRLQSARYFGSLSWKNVLGIGGMLAIPEISGYKRLRKKSEDLDFIVNDAGLDAILRNEPVRIDSDSLPGSSAEWYVVEKNGISCAFLHNEIRGYKIPEKAFEEAVYKETIVGPVFTISPELNVALKVRRSTYQNEDVHGKDALDAASIIIGMQLSGREFNHEAFVDYLIDATQDHCSTDGLLERIDQLGKVAANNLPKKDRQLFLDPLQMSADYLREKTNYEQHWTNLEQGYHNQSPAS